MRSVAPLALVASLAVPAYAERLITWVNSAPLGPSAAVTLAGTLQGGAYRVTSGAPSGKLYSAIVQHDQGLTPTIALGPGLVTLGARVPPASNALQVWDMRLAGSVRWSFDVRLESARAELDLTGLATKQINLTGTRSTVAVQWLARPPMALELLRVWVVDGNYQLMGLGHTRARAIEIVARDGSYDLDFTGFASGVMPLKVRAGDGQVSLAVPERVGVRFVRRGRIASLSVPEDLDRAGRSENYASAEAKLELDIEAPGGSLTLRRF